jgi:glycosyltransferase involved in cell wall biosynthesis
MRVAVIESAPRGGLLHYAAALGGALADRGHDVDLVTARGHEPLANPSAVRVRAILPAAARSASEPPTGVRLLARRARIAATVVAASLRTLLAVARGGYDAVLLIDDLSVAPAAAGALALTWIPGGPRIAAVCHEPRPRSRRGSGVYERSPALLGLLRRLYPRLDVVLVHGEQSREQFERVWPPSRLAVIAHGNVELPVDAAPEPSDEERILFFGEWRRAKGLPELMEAFERLAFERPAATLTIAGVPTPDSDPDRIRGWAAGHGDRVTIIDRYVELEEVPELFGSARVVVAPYVAGSQSGVVHLAMTMARAVVASDVGELPSTVVGGETGLIVPAGDVAALERALADLLADPGLAERLGAAGRRRASTEFSWQATAEQIERALAAR